MKINIRQQRKTAGNTKRKIGIRRIMELNWEFLLMALPGALLTFVFAYLPMFGLVIAFKSIDYSKGILRSPWVGFENFKFLFSSPDTFIILRNTIGYNLVFIVLGVVIPVTLSILLSRLRNKIASKIYQTIMILPHFISWVVVSYIVYAFLNYRLGLVNGILTRIGVEPKDWYTMISAWPFIIILLNTWKTFGYNSVVYLATIAGIDQTLYEAAAIDGANKRQQTWYITLPELANVVIIMTILAIGQILSANFDLFYAVPMQKGALFPVTNVISTFVYRALKINGDVGMSSAAGFLQSVVGFLLVILTNSVVRRIDESKAMF